MRVAICEDDFTQAKHLKHLIISEERRQNYEVLMYQSGESLICAFEDNEKFDIIFLDMKMKKLNGYETAKAIREIDEKVMIIIVTTAIDYAIKGYAINAFDFILKPIKGDRLNDVFARIARQYSKTLEGKYLIHTRQEKIYLDHNEILYMESEGRRLNVVTNNGCFSHYQNISEVATQLENCGYIRCHRSFLVNLRQVYRVHLNNISLKNDIEVPMSKRKHKVVYDAFTDYVVGQSS